jgi:hypothetical protein
MCLIVGLFIALSGLIQAGMFVYFLYGYFTGNREITFNMVAFGWIPPVACYFLARFCISCQEEADTVDPMQGKKRIYDEDGRTVGYIDKDDD